MAQIFTSFPYTLWATRQVAEYPIHWFIALFFADEAVTREIDVHY